MLAGTGLRQNLPAPAPRKRVDPMVPHDSAVPAALLEIQALTAQMLRAGAAGEWLQVEALDQQRYRVLHELPLTADDNHVAVLREALAATSSLTTLATSARATEQTTLEALRRGQRGVGRYLEYAVPR